MKDLKEKVEMKNFDIDLNDVEELEPIESPSSIIGPWFFVHNA